MNGQNRFRLIRRALCLLVLAGLIVGAASGCGKKGVLDPDNPVTLTFWHTYGQQMTTSMGQLVDEFNSTVGLEQGIAVRIDYIADASEVHEMLLMAAGGDPGAPTLPDIAVIYPRAGVALAEMGLLVDFAEQFSADELSRYVPEFLDEGRLGGDALHIIPVAKSTEVLYLNATVFERFAEDTGAAAAQLATFEGIIDVSEKYYEWSGGKSFIHYVELFNYAMTGYQQMGEELVGGDGGLDLSSPAFERIWDVYYPPAVKGGVAIFDNYGNYLMASGEIVCAIGSSASVTFYPDSVTFADNTKEPMELAILPHPVFEGGENVVMQRGGGLCVFKSDGAREYAAGLFLKWLTAPENNTRFTAETGYIPVTDAAFRDFLSDGLSMSTDQRIRDLYETVIYMHGNYSFYVPPVFDGFEEMQRNYNQALRRAAENSRKEYLDLLDTLGPDSAYQAASQGAYERFVSGSR